MDPNWGRTPDKRREKREGERECFTEKIFSFQEIEK
jgi:hypothetical protein